ncbi:hypothetical protein QJS10_CPB12g01101 [Acorus calamus]|uniref:Uncharacterized protein n=1 Tax=Acorus calamus TaxID=4465 RepID=A0AAV9DL01_ACOCL|nr:hypothetical protein QJS10_CPB12g01101 [Acorus calamus]
MGNCLETCTHGQQEHQQQEDEQSKVSDYDEKVGGFKVKIVLTKAELDWLMFELEMKEGGRSLEEVLDEIERERERERVKSPSWKPSLERIMECPEVQCIEEDMAATTTTS